MLQITPQMRVLVAYAIEFAYATLAGMLYGLIFRRAANDLRAGWLFGMSSGFLFWMLAPGSVALFRQDFGQMNGTPALGILLFQLVPGTVLGSVFPWIHGGLMRCFCWFAHVAPPGVQRAYHRLITE